MKRYSSLYPGSITLLKDGDYVLFEDHQAALDEVLKEAVWIAEALKLHVEMDWAYTLASDIEGEAVQQAAKRDVGYQRAQALLGSERVREWRERHEKEPV